MEEFEFEDLDLDNEWLDQLEKDNKKYKDLSGFNIVNLSNEELETIELKYKRRVRIEFH